MRQLLLALALAFGFAAEAGAQQAYPQRTIRIISPFAPGGSNDWVSRVIAKSLAESLKQSVIVENRPGAGTLTATEYVAKSTPDGYTLLMSSNTGLAIAPGLYPKLPYDPSKDFTYIGTVASGPYLMVVHPALAAHSVRELIALAKAKPGKLTFATPGNGTPAHLGWELFKYMTGTDIVHVPYKGNAPALVDVMGWQVDMAYDPIGTAIPQANAGKIRVLAVSSLQRTPLLPDVPTVAEAGLAGYEVNVVYGLIGAAGIPQNIVARLNAEIANALNSAEIKSGMAKFGLDPLRTTPEQFAAVIREEGVKWARVIKASGARPD